MRNKANDGVEWSERQEIGRKENEGRFGLGAERGNERHVAAHRSSPQAEQFPDIRVGHAIVGFLCIGIHLKINKHWGVIHENSDLTYGVYIRNNRQQVRSTTTYLLFNGTKEVEIVECL